MKGILLGISLSLLLVLSGCDSESDVSNFSNSENESIMNEIDNDDSMTEEDMNPISIFAQQHSKKQILYQLIADIDGDDEVEYFAVAGDAEGENPVLWYIEENGTGEVIVDAADTTYLATELLDRGDEKHISFTAYYPPSNTQLWTVRLENQKPNVVFEFMADWTIRIIPKGFQMVWKEYKDSEEGGMIWSMKTFFGMKVKKRITEKRIR